ncbi:hypothetical protein [Lactobacillus pentosus] [Lactiplantibacillus mudanjiangensis]|uniref:hypothetical protein n=1 Tax=Lactiplantibacillus mudanjiangensis TaxID=1296538 RepID=UPI001014AFDE|nr:hypothetical protein [Lactiplantibacillus mudanjiangensis]VDG33355.1 hypothetical protein [Lactobacillus pentosus] [Lactiplantibacillus mudanjiangensis]
MIAIKAVHGHPVLAEGSHAELSREIYAKRLNGEWQYPVAIVSNQTKFNDDEGYYATLSKGPTETDMIKMFKAAYRAGNKTLKQISDATELTYSQARRLSSTYNLRKRELWEAERIDKSGRKIQTCTANDMAQLLGAPVTVIKQVIHTNGIVLGYRIRKKERIHD